MALILIFDGPFPGEFRFSISRRGSRPLLEPHGKSFFGISEAIQKPKNDFP